MQPISGSISSKLLIKVLLAQVEVSTTSNHLVHVPTLLNRHFARIHQVSLRKLHCPTSVVVIDGRPIASENIAEDFKSVRVVLDNLACVISFNIISILEHPIVLGLLWFEQHNPKIEWRKRKIKYHQQDNMKP